jgi:hypothetical protein
LYSLFFSTKDKDWVEKKRRKNALMYATQQLQCKPTFFAGMLKEFFLEYEKIKIKQLENRRFYALKELSRPVQQYHMK